MAKKVKIPKVVKVEVVSNEELLVEEMLNKWCVCKTQHEMMMEMVAIMDEGEQAAASTVGEVIECLACGKMTKYDNMIGKLNARLIGGRKWDDFISISRQIKREKDNTPRDIVIEKQDTKKYIMTKGFTGWGFDNNLQGMEHIWLGIGNTNLEDRGCKVVLGPFEIRLPLGVQEKVYITSNGKASNTLRGVSYIHPHVASDGSLCAGNYNEVVRSYITTRNFIPLMEIILSVLHNYNRHNPYAEIDQFALALGSEGIRCSLCGEWVDDMSTMIECRNCNRYFCIKCDEEEKKHNHTVCHICKEEEEKKGLYRCRICRESISLYTCVQCGKKMCSNHTCIKSNGVYICLSCHKLNNKEDEDKKRVTPVLR